MATSVAVQRAEEKPVTITPVENLMDRVNKMSQAITQRAYEIFEGNGRRFGHDLEDWFKAEMDMLHPVHVNIAEAEDSLEVKAEVPGFSEKEIEVSVEPRRLTITGKRETETTKRREEKQDGLFGILLEPDPANCRSACECGCREDHRNFEEWRPAVDDAKSCQGENDRDQAQGRVVSRIGADGQPGSDSALALRTNSNPGILGSSSPLETDGMPPTDDMSSRHWS